MPIKDQQARREYFKEYMANRRKGLTTPNSVKLENKLNLVKPPSEVLNPELVKPIQTVKPKIDEKENVKPEPALLNPDLIVKPLAGVKPIQNNSVKPEVVKPTEKVKPVKPNPMLNPQENVKPQLWSSYYSVKKPRCSACQQKGIPENHYAFCSRKRVQDALTIRLPNRYVCQVYHWTLFQGQGKIKKGEKSM